MRPGDKKQSLMESAATAERNGQTDVAVSLRNMSKNLPTHTESLDYETQKALIGKDPIAYAAQGNTELSDMARSIQQWKADTKVALSQRLQEVKTLAQERLNAPGNALALLEYNLSLKNADASQERWVQNFRLSEKQAAMAAEKFAHEKGMDYEKLDQSKKKLVKSFLILLIISC